VLVQGERHAELRSLLESIDGPICRMSNQLENIEDHLDGQCHALLNIDHSNASRTRARQHPPLAVGTTI